MHALHLVANAAVRAAHGEMREELREIRSMPRALEPFHKAEELVPTHRPPRDPHAPVDRPHAAEHTLDCLREPAPGHRERCDDLHDLLIESTDGDVDAVAHALIILVRAGMERWEFAVAVHGPDAPVPVREIARERRRVVARISTHDLGRCDALERPVLQMVRDDENRLASKPTVNRAKERDDRSNERRWDRREEVLPLRTHDCERRHFARGNDRAEDVRPLGDERTVPSEDVREWLCGYHYFC